MALVVLTVILYPIIRERMLNQSAVYTSVKSNLTVNFLLGMYLYGVVIDRWVQSRIGKVKGWLVWTAGVAVIVVSLKYVFGWATWW